MAAALFLSATLPAIAFGEDAAQPEKAADATQAEPASSHAPSHGAWTMVRYPKPVMHNGKLVLWHGVWRGRGKAASAAPASQPAAAPATASTVAPHAYSLLADGADPAAMRMAGELASVVGVGDVQVKTIAGRTSRAAIAKAIETDAFDLAVVPVDGLVDSVQSGADWRKRAPYVARLHDEDVELIAPRAITDIHQLVGRKVNVDAADSATATSASIIFSHLKVAANWTNYPLGDALTRLAQGQIDAVLVVGGGDSDALTSFGGDGRFHVVAIPYAPALRAYYTPDRLTAADRPKLIAADEKVDTIATPIALVAVDGTNPQRADRIAPAVKSFLANFDQLLDEAKDARWRRVNLAARIDQLPRFGAAQAWLDQNKGETSADFESFRAMAQAANASNDGPSGDDSDRLYKGLMRLSGAGQ